MTTVAQQSYGERAENAPNPVSRRLLELMERKETNLSVGSTATSAEELLQLADAVGPHICCLKTHINILEDYDSAFPQRLQEIAERHDFVIFEDCKFSDIGDTVRRQYGGGIYRIASWADLVNAHVISGPGIIEGLKEVGLPLERGLLLIGQMSSQGSLAEGKYTDQAIAFAHKYEEFVAGFICQERLSQRPGMIHMTPGVNLASRGDNLRQQYNTPDSVIREKGSDIIIVKRGITEAENPTQAAEEYRRAGWDAYRRRIAGAGAAV